MNTRNIFAEQQNLYKEIRNVQINLHTLCIQRDFDHEFVLEKELDNGKDMTMFKAELKKYYMQQLFIQLELQEIQKPFNYIVSPKLLDQTDNEVDDDDQVPSIDEFIDMCAGINKENKFIVLLFTYSIIPSYFNFFLTSHNVNHFVFFLEKLSEKNEEIFLQFSSIIYYHPLFLLFCESLFQPAFSHLLYHEKASSYAYFYINPKKTEPNNKPQKQNNDVYENMIEDETYEFEDSNSISSDNNNNNLGNDLKISKEELDKICDNIHSSLLNNLTKKQNNDSNLKKLPILVTQVFSLIYPKHKFDHINKHFFDALAIFPQRFFAIPEYFIDLPITIKFGKKIIEAFEEFIINSTCFSNLMLNNKAKTFLFSNIDLACLKNLKNPKFTGNSYSFILLEKKEGNEKFNMLANESLNFADVQTHYYYFRKLLQKSEILPLGVKINKFNTLETVLKRYLVNKGDIKNFVCREQYFEAFKNNISTMKSYEINMMIYHYQKHASFIVKQEKEKQLLVSYFKHTEKIFSKTSIFLKIVTKYNDDYFNNNNKPLTSSASGNFLSNKILLTKGNEKSIALSASANFSSDVYKINSLYFNRINSCQDILDNTYDVSEEYLRYKSKDSIIALLQYHKMMQNVRFLDFCEKHSDLKEFDDILKEYNKINCEPILEEIVKKYECKNLEKMQLKEHRFLLDKFSSQLNEAFDLNTNPYEKYELINATFEEFQRWVKRSFEIGGDDLHPFGCFLLTYSNPNKVVSNTLFIETLFTGNSLWNINPKAIILWSQLTSFASTSALPEIHRIMYIKTIKINVFSANDCNCKNQKSLYGVIKQKSDLSEMNNNNNTNACEPLRCIYNNESKIKFELLFYHNKQVFLKERNKDFADIFVVTSDSVQFFRNAVKDNTINNKIVLCDSSCKKNFLSEKNIILFSSTFFDHQEFATYLASISSSPL